VTDLDHLQRQLSRLRDQLAILGAHRPTPAELDGEGDVDKDMARRIHQARPGIPPHYVLATLEAFRAVLEMEPAEIGCCPYDQTEATVQRVTDLYEQWVKAGAPPLGVPLARWWDRRLAELHNAIHPPTDATEQR